MQNSDGKMALHQSLRKAFLFLPDGPRVAIDRSFVDCNPNPDPRSIVRTAEGSAELELAELSGYGFQGWSPPRQAIDTRGDARVAMGQLGKSAVTAHYSSRQGQRLQRFFCRYDGGTRLTQGNCVNAQQPGTRPEDLENATRLLAP